MFRSVFLFHNNHENRYQWNILRQISLRLNITARIKIGKNFAFYIVLIFDKYVEIYIHICIFWSVVRFAFFWKNIFVHVKWLLRRLKRHNIKAYPIKCRLLFSSNGKGILSLSPLWFGSCYLFKTTMSLFLNIIQQKCRLRELCEVFRVSFYR